MQLELDDAVYAADKFIDYFSNMGRIDEYLRNVKLDRMEQMPSSILGIGPEDDMFDASYQVSHYADIHQFSPCWKNNQ